MEGMPSERPASAAARPQKKRLWPWITSTCSRFAMRRTSRVNDRQRRQLRGARRQRLPREHEAMVVARIEAAIVSDAVQRLHAARAGRVGGRLERRAQHDRLDAEARLRRGDVATANARPGRRPGTRCRDVQDAHGVPTGATERAGGRARRADARPRSDPEPRTKTRSCGAFEPRPSPCRIIRASSPSACRVRMRHSTISFAPALPSGARSTSHKDCRATTGVIKVKNVAPSVTAASEDSRALVSHRP